MDNTTRLLKKTGMIKDTMDYEDTDLALVYKYPVHYGDKILEVVDRLSEYYRNNGSYLLQKHLEYLTSNIRYKDISQNRDLLYVDNIIKLLSELMGEEQAQQYYKMLEMISQNEDRCHENIIHAINTLPKIKETVVSIRELCMILWLLVIQMYTVSQVDSIYNITEAKRYTFRQMIRDGFMRETPTDELIIDSLIPCGTCIDMPLEDRKNIIGSLWNCIIDMITYGHMNQEVEDEGGELNELHNCTNH